MKESKTLPPITGFLGAQKNIARLLRICEWLLCQIEADMEKNLNEVQLDRNLARLGAAEKLMSSMLKHHDRTGGASIKQKYRHSRKMCRADWILLKDFMKRYSVDELMGAEAVRGGITASAQYDGANSDSGDILAT